MKNLCAALFFLLCASAAQAENVVGPSNAILCNQVAYAAPSTATTTILVPAVAGKIIVICGWHVTSSTTTDNSFAFVRGTQTTTPCDTGPVTIIGALHIINSAPSVDHVSVASLSTPVAQQVCVTTTAATALQIVLWYTQF